MATAELIHFETIPTKVTINEIIELAKRYSTDKSNVFINGVLDAVVVELIAENKLSKSGRGLIS
jgi:N utilization substance protein B